VIQTRDLREVTGSNPVEALIFFRLLLSNCLNWKIYCDDNVSLSSTTAVQKWIISYKLHKKKKVCYHNPFHKASGHIIKIPKFLMSTVIAKMLLPRKYTPSYKLIISCHSRLAKHTDTLETLISYMHNGFNKSIYSCLFILFMLFTSQEVRVGKNCPWSLEVWPPLAIGQG